MPRPKRARQAAHSASKTNEHEEEPITRGRSRTTRSMGARTSVGHEQALRAAEGSRDAALGRLANEDNTTTGDDTVGSIEIGRRAETPQRRDTTGLDLADEVFDDLEESFDLPDGGRAFDNSSLYGSSHIKPRSRSRQSSIIGRNDPPIRPSSRGGNTPLMGSSFNIGAFRRRAREPSILGTGRKSRPDVTLTTQDDELESGGEEFAPEAESTPINNRRRTRHSAQMEQQQSPELPELQGSRKRKSDGLPESKKRPDKVSRTEENASLADSDNDSDLSSLSSPRDLPPMERPATPNREEYAAPPASSGSEDGGGFWPDIHGLAKRRRRPSVTDLDNLSNVSSPPSLTHSPNRAPTKAPKPRGRSRTRQGTPPSMTTADLASLLPRRRHKKTHNPDEMGSDEEYDASALGEDQDELSYLDTQTSRRKKDSRPAHRAASFRAASRSGRGSGSALTKKQTPASTTRSASGRRPTYSSRSSDKENQSEDEGEEEPSMFEPLPDDTFDAGTGEADRAASSEELKNAARYFAEVDRWELSFEEASEPESPVGAR